MSEKHWSNTELLHQTVTNPNIIVKGTHSYYSDCWDTHSNILSNTGSD